jgi:hypothetical protein
MKPILKLTKRELETLEAARSIMSAVIVDSRVQGESREAAALRERLRDGEQNIRRMLELAALPV